jgi:hypothetical protein
MSTLLQLVTLVALAILIILQWRQYKVASTTQDLLREVQETVQSVADENAKVTLLLQAAVNNEGQLTPEQLDTAVASLQSVQDSAAAVTTAISAVLSPPAPVTDPTAGSASAPAAE